MTRGDVVKRCTICKETKAYTDFHKQSSRADGYANWCKPCKAAKKREDYLKNRDAALASMKEYREKNKEKVSKSKKLSRLKKIEQYKTKARSSYVKNRDERKAKCAEYRRNNWPEVLARNTKYKRERLRADPIYRLQYSVRNRTFVAFRDKGFGKSSRTREIIGCDWEELMAHMERQFSEGMTLDNYGKWHVDHKVPLSSAKTEEELISLCHYTNLQPLWAADNIRKGAKILEAA